MNEIIIQMMVGLGLSGLVVMAAYRLKTLSLSGALAAFLLGFVFFGLGGLRWAVLLLSFFISSSALSRLFKRRKIALDEKFSKGSRRDAGQVLANGGIAGLFVILAMFFPDSGWPWLACAGSLAAVNADTWATELGVLNPREPRLITTWKMVDRGTSGAVSAGGTLAALAGAGFIALAAALVSPPANPEKMAAQIIGVTLAGLGGSLVDSLLGATVQAIYSCSTCRKETERHPQHTCGTETTLVRGWKWLDNDLVNTACALAGGGFALLAFWWTWIG